MDSKTLRIVLEAQDKSSGVMGAIGDKLQNMGLISQNFSNRLKDLSDSSVTTSEKLKTLGSVASIAIAGGLAIAAEKAVKSAADYQSQLVKLVTSAGESHSNLKLVGDGILKVSTATGTSADSLSKAMYVIESGGQHGAEGLKVLKAASEGARAEMADVNVVADALTSVLQDYHLKAKDAGDVTSKMVAAVGAGKTTFQEFAGSLHSVLPIASSANISLTDVSAAIASMTVHGMSADQATQNLSDTIKHMVAPTQVQTKELGQLGISSGDLSNMLNQNSTDLEKMAKAQNTTVESLKAHHVAGLGLTGTLQYLSETIIKKMGPDGKVMLDSFNQSKDAANDANIMISKMPTSIQAMAKAYQGGKMSVADYREQVKALPTDQAVLMNQFKSLNDRAHGFNDLLKSGSPAAQTYQDALRRVTGDATGLNTSLMLTGENKQYVENALKAIGGATTEAGGHVKGFAEWQTTLNAKTDIAKQSLHNMSISIGTALLPAVTSLMNGINKLVIPITEWTTKHKDLTVEILGVVGGIAVLVASISLIGGAVSKLKGAYDTITSLPGQIKDGFESIAKGAKKAADIAGSAWDGAKSVMSKGWDFAKLIAGYVSTAAKAVAGAAATAAGHIAAAAASAAAWIAANAVMLLGVGLLIAVIVGAVIMIVKHWSTIKHFFEKLWKDIEDFVKKHWKVILEIIIGPIAIIALHWKEILHFFDKLWSGVVDFCKAHWKIMLDIILGPIGLIITNWKTISKFFSDLWNDIKAIFNVVKGWIIDFFKMEYNGVINIWNGVTRFFSGIWEGIKGIVRGLGGIVVGIFRAEWNGMVNIWNGVTGFFSGLWSGLKSGMGSVVGIIKEPFRSAFNAIADLWNGTVGKLSFHAPSWVPGIGGKGFDMPKLPHLATGTNYFQGGMALVGENGPELAIMPQGTKVIPNGQTQQMMNQGGQQNHYHFNVNVGAYAGQPGEIDKLGELLWQSFQRTARRHGRADVLPNIGIRPQ